MNWRLQAIAFEFESVMDGTEPHENLENKFDSISGAIKGVKGAREKVMIDEG